MCTMAPGCFACFGKPKPPEDAVRTGVSGSATAEALLVIHHAPKRAEPDPVAQPVGEDNEEPAVVAPLLEPAGMDIPAEVPPPETLREVPPVKNNQITPKKVPAAGRREDSGAIMGVPLNGATDTSPSSLPQLENGPMSPTSLLLSNARSDAVNDPRVSSSQLLMGLKAIQGAPAGLQDFSLEQDIQLNAGTPPSEEQEPMPLERENESSQPALASIELQLEHAAPRARPEHAAVAGGAAAPQQWQSNGGGAAAATPDRRGSGILPVMSTPRDKGEEWGGPAGELMDAHDRDLIAGESHLDFLCRMLGHLEGLRGIFLREW